MLSESTGRYEIISSLAAGGMAEVFLARVSGAAGFSKLVALKRIHSELADDTTFVERFLDEARIAAQLNHPNIVQIFDLGIADGSYFLAMEYVHGKTVWDLCKEASRRQVFVPLDVSLGILVAACEGLGFAHDQRDGHGDPMGIIHRDVSPQNLLISFDGAVKVADFGIARVSGAAHKTEVGAIVGKLSYMSPEQMLAEPVDRRTDVYALGVIMHELLTSQKLWNAQQLDPNQRRDPHLPSSVNPDLPPALDDITLRALSYDVDQRYANCDALREDLERVMASQGIVNSSRRRAELAQSWFPNDKTAPTDPHSMRGNARPKLPTIQLERDALNLTGTGKSNVHKTSPRGHAPSEASVTPLESQPTRLAPQPTAPPTPTPTPTPPSAPTPQAHVTRPMAPIVIEDTARTPLPDPTPTTPPSGMHSHQRLPLPPMAPPASSSSRAQLMVVSASLVLLLSAGLYTLLRPRHTVETPVTTEPAPPPPAIEVTPPANEPAKPEPPVAPVAAPPGRSDPPPSNSDDPRIDPKLEPKAKLEPPIPSKHHHGDEPKPTPPKPSKGALTLSSTPPTTVYLGKSSLGKTPLRDAPLPAGKNRLRLVAKDAGIDLPIDVEVTAGETSIRTVTIGKGKLRIKALPWAAVSIDGADLGTTPLPPQPLYAGTHSVTLTYKPEGGAPKVRREQVTIKESEDRLLEADLR
jgi:serine/threonine protein kinase